MFKKMFVVTAAVLLVLGLLFGRKLVPYASATFNNIRSVVNDHVPIELQLDAAREQLEDTEKDLRDMTYQIAKEKVAVQKLQDELTTQKDRMAVQFESIMKLRDHLDSGDSQYVAVNNRTYSNTRVKDDLTKRFKMYKTGEQTVQKLEQIIELRAQGLDSAEQKREEAIAQRRELEVQIENLSARQKMVDVAKTASRLNIDDSRLSRTREMIEEIETRLDVEEAMMHSIPHVIGQIPVENEYEETGDIVEEIDNYFDKNGDFAAVR